VSRIRFRHLLILGPALLALAGCGGGGGGSTDTAAVSPPPSTPSATATAPVATATTPTTPSTPTQTVTSPEDQPGGAGDEKAISTQAQFTGKDGDITPPTIRVPPFISVKVVLRSADGAEYEIEVAHHELKVDSGSPRATLQLSGLRAGKRYLVNVSGAPETLAIVANAEPGP
jgi:hypothetical protein